MKYDFYLNIIALKAILYRIISITIFTVLFGHKFAFAIGLMSLIIYLIYEFIFCKIFRIKAEHKGFVLWFTGLPCSGKSTLADAVNEYLKRRGFKTERLDGDVVRYGRLSDDLGFSKEDRDKNIRRITFVSKLLSRQKIAVLASFVSPYRKIRQQIKESVTNFVEIYVKCPADKCAERDVKGMWAKAKSGEIKGFTGYSAPYEAPFKANVTCNTEQETLEKSTQKIISYLKKRKLI